MFIDECTRSSFARDKDFEAEFWNERKKLSEQDESSDGVADGFGTCDRCGRIMSLSSCLYISGSVQDA